MTPQDPTLHLFLSNDCHDINSLRTCAAYVVDPSNKGILDKLLGLLRVKEEDTLVNSVEHIVELLRYILKSEKGKYSNLKPLFTKICEYQSNPRLFDSVLKLLTTLYDPEVTPAWVIDTVGFEPMSHFISKSSSFAINILCSVVNKDRLPQLLDLIILRHYVLANHELSKVLLTLFDGDNRQKIYSVLMSILNVSPSGYTSVCGTLYTLASNDENRRWLMSNGVIEKLYAVFDLPSPNPPVADSSQKPTTPALSAPTRAKRTKRGSFSIHLVDQLPKDDGVKMRETGEHLQNGKENGKEGLANCKNDHEVLVSCINVTCKLAELEETHKQIVQAGGLVLIVQCLKIENKNLRNVSAIALRSLSKMNDDNEIALVQLGAIEALLPLLKTRSEPFLQNVMGAFRCVCFLPDHAQRMAKLGGVGYISEILSEAVDDMTLLHALGMIRNLIDFDDISVMIDEAGVVLILIQKLRAISLYGEIDNITMMLEIFSVCLTAEELGPMPAILFVEHDCVPILLKLLTKHNTACTCAIFEILVHIVVEKELCHSIICPELNILFDDLEFAPEDVSDFFMELHVNSNLRNKLCLFLLENCQIPKMYGLIAKYPALEGFEEHLTDFLSENNFVNLKRYVNSNNPYWVFCGTAAMVMLGKRATWQGFEGKMVKNLFDVLTSANLVFAVSTTQNKICSYRKIAAYALGVLFKKTEDQTKVDEPKLPYTDNYESMLNNTKYADVRFVFEEGEPIFAHRMLLAHRCEYFRDLFGCGFKEQTEKDIPVGEANRDIFYALIKYIYTTTLTITDVKFALELLQLAEMYRLSELKEEIIDYVLCEIKEFYNKCTVTNKAESPFLNLEAFDHFSPASPYSFGDIEWIITVAHFAERIYHARLLECCCKVLPEILVHIINVNANLPLPEIEALHNTMALVKQVLQQKLLPETKPTKKKEKEKG
eukprot:Phypoly_transcript_02060.p1 GENE.Phypoly_transcript_02060~~Phypoly_transcript_02060.p1  ORF type:complete len:942 (+),score=135.78 Phypoly_transcript_02060:88-2913(+)